MRRTYSQNIEVIDLSKAKLISLEESLKNVTPFTWNKKVVNGEEEVILENKNKKGDVRK